MNKIKHIFFRHLLLLLLFVSTTVSLFSQTPSTQGTEFFVTFMKNGYAGCNGNSSQEALKIIITALDSCSVTVTNPSTGWTTFASIPANGLVQIPVPPIQGYNEVSEQVQNKGIYVVATNTISLYISNEANNSFDASFVLPIPSLADDYVVQCYSTYPGTTSCANNNRACFIIIATEDSTIVDITPTKLTQGNHAANVPFSVTLQRGQTYFVYSALPGANADLSGSRIKARDCKKISVFNGVILTTIPISQPNGADHIFEQAMPRIYLGKNFVVTSSLNRPLGDFVRVTAVEDSTRIYRDGVLLATINAYATHQFIIDFDPGAVFVETNKPVIVNLFNTTSYHDDSPDGDPSMVWISPVEQQIKDIVFGTFQTVDGSSVHHHYVNIITETTDVSSMQLNGVNISADFNPVPGNTSYSFARKEIPYGNHHLTSNSGFTAHIYGFGAARGYAYSVGSSTIDLSGVININGVPTTELDLGFFNCQSDSILFTVNALDYDSIIWNMGDGHVFSQDSVYYLFDGAGEYLITNIVRLNFTNCLGNLYDTIYYTLTVKPNLEYYFQDNICYGDTYDNWGFHIENVTMDTLVVDSATTISTCSVAFLQLHVYPVYDHYDTIITCPENLPIEYGNFSITNRGTFPVHFTAVTGCDSIILLTVIYDGTTDAYLADTACMGYPYQKYRFDLDPINEEGIFDFERLQYNDDGCDTLFHLTLTVMDPTVTIEPLIEPFCEYMFTNLMATSHLPLIVWTSTDTVKKYDSLPLVTVYDIGTYIATAHGFDCFTTDSLVIEKCCPPDDYAFPNVITPSQLDGVNDFFTVPEEFYPFTAEIYIYNRWGREVYHSTETDFKWGGEVNGKVTLGVYYYTLHLNNYCKYHGSLTVF
ncbi:MAG: gliding motility-associated C-terminal domain-containing protein [Bacteroidales bacterium]|jgi:gliding motility-associated-like protein|nr:gliding motility-associated C-terminal domain-containing protein [Bacteroidales bacterium]